MFLLLCPPLLCRASSLSPADIASPPAWKVPLPPPHYTPPGSENLFIILPVSAKSSFPLGKPQDFPHVWYRTPPECPTAPLILAILTPMTLVALSVKGETTCNTRDPGLIPRSGRSPGEGNGYPLKFSWTSFVAQLVKNLRAIRETWV